MGGDEYAYYSGARKLPDISLLKSRDPYLQLAPNLVFLGLGKLFFLISRNPDLLMKVFNGVAFSMSVLLVCIILYRLTQGRFPLYAPVIISLLPFSAFSAYFMPETLYALIFLSLALVVIFLIPKYDLLAVCIGGILSAALVLTKPHGISVFVATLLTILSLFLLPVTLRLGWRRAPTLVGLFVLSAYVSEIVLSWAITSNLSWNPLLFVGSGYKDILDESVGVLFSSGLFAKIGQNAVGHIIVLLFICAIPLAYFWGWLRSIFSRTGLSTTFQTIEFRRIHILVVFTLLATLATIAMTVNFAVQISQYKPSELVRLHGRYYSYVLFLYILGYFVLQKKSPPALILLGGVRLWGILGLIAAVLMFWVQRAFTIYPWDYPEIFSVSLWGGSGTRFLGWAIIVMGIIVYGLISIKPKLHLILFPVFILILFLASNYMTIEWQFARSERVGLLAIQGRALRDLIPETERDRGTIIGSDRYGIMSYFLFGFSSDAWVRVIPEGESITLDMLPPDTDWVILLDNYDLNIPIKSLMSTGEVWLGWLSPNSPAIHERMELWEGKPLQFTFGTGEITHMLDQFNEPETWGAWSATDGARILLPVMISGKVRIEIVGWINPESSAQQLHLLVGSTSVPVEFGTNKGKSCMIIDLLEPAQIITLRGIDPFRQNPQARPLAVALVELKIYRAGDVPREACSPWVPLK
jgi:phosphoglycerol transferase